MMLGVAYISSFLKSHGHNIDILNFSKMELKKSTIDEKLAEFKPGLIGISVLSTHFENDAKKIAKMIKTSSGIPIIAGGTAVTSGPDSFINCKDIDMVCLGEGEHAMLELAEKISSQKDYTDVRNLWVKNKEAIVRNPVRPFIKDLDEMPFPDSSLFPPGDCIFIMASRGCPYDCSFCINSNLRRLYGGQGYMRIRSPENVISEIRELKERYARVRYVWFYDDVFPSHKKWVDRFGELYSRYKIQLPFSINLRTELCSDGLIKTLKKAGLSEVRMGIESGDENIREKYLNRSMTDKSIKDAFQTARNNHVSTRAYNIIGIPGESKESVFKTILLNLEVNASKLQYSIFQPYPGTVLGQECLEKRYSIKEIRSVCDYFSESAILTPYLAPEDIKNLAILISVVNRRRVFFCLLIKLSPKYVKILFNVILRVISFRRNICSSFLRNDT